MMYILIIFAIGIIGLLIRIYSSNSDVNKKLNRKDELNNLIVKNVSVNSKSFINEESTKAIVIDEPNKKVHLFSLIENKYNYYKFEDVIQCEVIIDNDTVISSKRGSQVLGTVVGGLIAGVPGAIIGSLSGRKIQSENIKTVDLKLTLNNLDDAIFKINFLNPLASNQGLSRDFYMVKDALTEIEKWQGYFNVILKQQNQVI